MPVRLGEDKKGAYAAWGQEGKKYYYTKGNPQSLAIAKAKANAQGRAIHASGGYEATKVGFDFDDTLTKVSMQNKALQLIKNGVEVYIVTRRQESASEAVYKLADELGIKRDNVYFTNGKLKWETVQKLGLDVFYDNNKNELDKIRENTNTVAELAFAESYTDYPQAASYNAQQALEWAEKNGWGDCVTPVGKARARQLANREPISRDTIARMAAFERHRQNSDRPLGEGCGRLMWQAWGGDEGIAYAKRKLKEIDNGS